MATFKIAVFKHQVRRDGKYPVSIRVYWKRQYSYVGTEYYVTIHQISQNRKKGTFELKDTFVTSELLKRINLLEEAKTKRLGLDIHRYTAKELARYFEKYLEEKSGGEDKEIDFIAFAREYIKKKKEKRLNVSRIYTSVNCLEDYTAECKLNTLYISSLTSRFLSGFEEFLKEPRTITRINQLGKPVTGKQKPVSDSTVAGYMTDIRTLFNEALRMYNDEENETVRIHHYPFRKYRLPKLTATKKRNLPAEKILKIIKAGDKLFTSPRDVLARDVFILSFCLAGMNCIDLYSLEPHEYANGRFSYNRTKTENRRADSALMSIRVEPEIVPYIQKYKDPTGKRVFDFHTRYANSQTFVSSMDKSLKKVAAALNMDEPLSSYYARHSWATIARNKCRISKSDVDECLNHAVPENRLADVYVEKDWSFLDEANRKVLDYVLSTAKNS
ncbi:MAG: site-specific integrase [Tannerella sp.]|jgi:integrase|nr:site-specific integrase [Tannerella sp.]